MQTLDTGQKPRQYISSIPRLSPTSTVRRQPNGMPHSTPNGTRHRTSMRAASNPALRSGREGSTKNLVAHFDQISTGTRRPSLPATENRSSRERTAHEERPKTARQPSADFLFGEIVPSFAKPTIHGIAIDHNRSTSETSPELITFDENGDPRLHRRAKSDRSVEDTVYLVTNNRSLAPFAHQELLKDKPSKIPIPRHHIASARRPTTPSKSPQLHAVINAPILQASPPLRSSRPRQDISARSVSPGQGLGIRRSNENVAAMQDQTVLLPSTYQKPPLRVAVDIDAPDGPPTGTTQFEEDSPVVPGSFPETSPDIDAAPAEEGTIQIILEDTPPVAQTSWYGETTPRTLPPSPWTPGSTGSAQHILSRQDSYTTVNKILEQYHQSGIVSPEMVHEFQQYILTIEPDLVEVSPHESMTVARTALEDIIRDRVGHSPLVTPVDPPLTVKPEQPLLPEVPDTDGSIGLSIARSSSIGKTSPRPTSEPPRDSGIGSREPSIEKDSISDVEIRRLTKRRNTIKELIDTEASYNQDMKVIEDIYKGTTNACEALTADDKRVLFGNSAQIVAFSETFLAALKQAGGSVYVMPRSSKWTQKRNSFSTSNSNNTTHDDEPLDDERDRKTFIGDTFIHHVPRMEEIYTAYLRNHDYANQRLKKLQEMPKVKLWLNECHTYAEDITSAWDLDSLLVKPVQRILKYPLLLKSLSECTPDDHPDAEPLKKAVKEMMDASFRINESKKRAEVLDQVMRNSKRKDFDLSKLVGRRTDKLRQQVGLSDAVEDADYKRVAQKFETRYVHFQIVMRDFEQYKKSAEVFMNQFLGFAKSIEELALVGHTNTPELESKWRKLVLTIRDMHNIAFADHDAAITRHCIDPIMTLIKLYDAPQKLMTKRKKRIVEYAKYITMKNRGEKVDRKTQEQGEQFIALNDTLKDELPRLDALSTQLVEACLRNFIDLQAQWHTIWQKKVKTVLEEQQIPADVASIVDAFNSDFSFVEAQVLSLGMCNGSMLADISNFLSTSFTDDSSTQRPSMQKSDSPPDRRHSGGSFASPSGRSSFESSHVTSPNAARYRAASNVSAPRSRIPPPSSYVPHQESRSRPDRQPNSRLSISSAFSQAVNPTRPASGSNVYNGPASPPSHQRRLSGGAFSSALPMSDSPSNSRPATPPQSYTHPSQRQYQVLFLAASLYDFNIAQERSEAGYPYLFYTPGEIFDVIGQKGELWLAKNQDDPTNRIGWIWEKHFAKLADNV